jgi:hypothetical protein
MKPTKLWEIAKKRRIMTNLAHQKAIHLPEEKIHSVEQADDHEDRVNPPDMKIYSPNLVVDKVETSDSISETSSRE